MNNFWQNKNVFITGASGILGSWLTRALINANANVTALIRDYVPRSQLVLSGTINKINIVRGALENYLDIERTLNEYEIDTVFHLGAQTIVTTALRSPRSTFKSNIEGTWNLLEAIRNSKSVKRTVIASTDKVYGEHMELPYTEEHQLKAIHPYDVSKACGDMLAQTYYKTYGVPLNITRCANIYGGGDLNFDRIIPGTIKSVIFKQAPLIRGDGTFLRDYIYVKDVVDAYLKLGESISEQKILGQIFNLGVNKPLNVLEIVNEILIRMRSTLKPKILNIVKHEIKNQYLSSKKANELLGWTTKYSIEEGLNETIKWYKNFFGIEND